MQTRTLDVPCPTRRASTQALGKETIQTRSSLLMRLLMGLCTVLVFGHTFALEDAIASHACSLEATMNSVTLLNGLKALEDAIASHACSLKRASVWPLAFYSVVHSLLLFALSMTPQHAPLAVVCVLKDPKATIASSNHELCHHADDVTQH
jgi:hypothetical protein